jgi:ureidoacrylate peracid hydrolase
MLRLRKIRIKRQDILVPEGKWGSEPYDGLVPQPGDMVVHRHHYSAFIGTGLADSLKNAGIETIIVTGVATNVCCETTIRDGCCEGFYVVVPRDCVATYDSEDHERSLEHMDNYYAVVTDSQAIMKQWQERKGSH